MAHKYTEEQKKFIKDNVKGRKVKGLTDMFNKEFGLNLRVSQIRAFKKNRGLKSGVGGRFKKGHKPWNKGLKGIVVGGQETQFKKGSKSHNWVPIGTERVNGDGYIDIKVDDGKLHKNWRGKHIVIWEKHNGPLPKNHVVIFGDGNKRNFDIDNLIMVSRQQLLMMNRNDLIQEDAELTRTAVIIADLKIKISEKKRRK